MKRLSIAVMATIALIALAAPSIACHTHGYVRASTLNDLFSQVANNDNGLVFDAPSYNDTGASTQQTNRDGIVSDHTLGDPNLDTGHYDDGHAFGWKMKGQNQGNWNVLTTGEGAQAQLDDIIASIENGLSENMDKNFAD